MFRRDLCDLEAKGTVVVSRAQRRYYKPLRLLNHIVTKHCLTGLDHTCECCKFYMQLLIALDKATSIVEIEQGFLWSCKNFYVSYKVFFMRNRNLAVTKQIAGFATSMI